MRTGRIGWTGAVVVLGMFLENQAEARQTLGGPPRELGVEKGGAIRGPGEGNPQALDWDVPLRADFGEEPGWVAGSPPGDPHPAPPAPSFPSLGTLMRLEEGESEGALQEGGQPSDLTLLNFFTEGWGETWVKRPRPDTAQNMALLKVTTNFLEREFRADYVYTHNVKGKPAIQDSHVLQGLIAYGLNRRLMIEVITNYEWDVPPPTPNVPKANGAGAAALLRFQLVDTYVNSVDLQVKVTAPNKWAVPPSPTTQTSIAFASGGFQDLQVLLGIPRLGLYESVQYENLSGPHKVGARQNDISYDLSLAETWTEPHLYPLGNFTTFLEAFGTTDLDGVNNTHSVFTLTPGVRFWFAHENSLTFGADLPISHPRQNDVVFRVTYILNF
jgi:hypothetical protein